MTSKHSARQPATTVPVVCADCWKRGRRSAQVALGVRTDLGWKLLDTTRETFLAVARRAIGNESRDLEDRQAANGYDVTDTRPPTTLVPPKDSIGRAPERLTFECRNSDCARRVTDVRTGRFMRRLDSDDARRRGVVTF